MVDTSHIKIHPHTAGAKGGNQNMFQTKEAHHQNMFGRGCDGIPIKILVTELPEQIVEKLST